MKKYLSAIALLLTYCCVHTQVYGTYTILRDASNLSRGTLDPYRVNSDTFTMRGHMDGLIAGITTTTVQIDNLITSTNSLKTEINLVRVATGSYAVTVYTDTSTLQTNIALVGVSTKTLADIVRVDTTTLQGRINQIATDTGTIKTEINLVRIATGSYAITVYTDTTTLQGRISQIATDTGTVRTDIALIGVSTKTLADAVGVATGSLAVAVYTDTTTLRSRINQLSIDTGSIKNAVALDTATLLSMVTFTNNATSTNSTLNDSQNRWLSTATTEIQTKGGNITFAQSGSTIATSTTYIDCVGTGVVCSAQGSSITITVGYSYRPVVVTSSPLIVYLATSGAVTTGSDIQGSFTTNYHKALEYFGAAGLIDASSAVVGGTIMMGPGDYFWNQTSTVPYNTRLMCPNPSLGSSSTIHMVQPATLTIPFLHVYGHMENCIIDVAGAAFAHKVLVIKSSSTGNNVELINAQAMDQTVADNMTLISVQDISNAYWRNIIVDKGWAGAVQDSTRNGGLLTFQRSTDTHIHLKYVTAGTFASVGKQAIGISDNYNCSLTGDDVTLGARALFFHNNSAGSGVLGSLTGQNMVISFKKLSLTYGSAASLPIYATCYTASGGGCYSTGTMIVNTNIVNTMAATKIISLENSGQSKSSGLTLSNINFVQNYTGATTFLTIGSEFGNTRFQNSRLFSTGGTVTAWSDSGFGSSLSGNNVILDGVKQ